MVLKGKTSTTSALAPKATLKKPYCTPPLDSFLYCSILLSRSCLVGQSDSMTDFMFIYYVPTMCEV